MASEDSPENLRSDQRRKQLKAAIIAFQNRHSTIPCRLRDISNTGAKIEVESPHVPDTFELLIELDGLECDCEVVWRKNNLIGVRFRTTPRTVEPKRIQVVAPTRPTQQASLRRKPAAV